MDLNGVKIIEIPEIRDFRGSLSFIEKDILPFTIKRVFYLYNVPNGASRGGHAHIEHLTFLVALNGSFEITLIDTEENNVIIKLDNPNKGLLIPNMIWHELNKFSTGAVCLVMASDIHKEEDYIRDFSKFLNF